MVECPVCQQGMKQEVMHGVTIDSCEQHGVWLDRSELLAITEAARHDSPAFQWSDLIRRAKRPPVDHDRTVTCPHCQTEMKIDNYKDVHIDWCREHGVWLDHGELDAILNNLRLDPLYVGKVAVRLWENRY